MTRPTTEELARRALESVARAHGVSVADVHAAVKAVAEALGDTGRILVRESGTEPLVRVMVEAPEHETCEKYVAQVVDVIKAKGYAL